jgi:hypothetical protein
MRLDFSPMNSQWENRSWSEHPYRKFIVLEWKPHHLKHFRFRVLKSVYKVNARLLSKDDAFPRPVAIVDEATASVTNTTEHSPF